MQRLAPLPVPARSDVALAETFLRNAASHVEIAERAALCGNDNAALHATAIAVELLLKSYLLSRATDDDWNRANMGHDLAKALHYSTQVGFGAPPRLGWLVGHLHPHFQRGGFHREPSRKWPGDLAQDASEIGRQLVQAIELQIRRARIAAVPAFEKTIHRLSALILGSADGLTPSTRKGSDYA